MTDRFLHVLDCYYALEKVNVGEFAVFQSEDMTFSLQVFQAQGLGHVSILKGRSFFGLVQKDSVIINPFHLDLPLYTYDRTRFLGIDKLNVELYNTVLSDFCSQELHRIKRQYSFLKERGSGNHFCDTLKLPSGFHKKSWVKNTKNFDQLTSDHFTAYLAASTSSVEKVEEKKEKSAFFVNLLLQNSPFLEILQKKMTPEKAKLLILKYIFGLA